MTKILIVDDDPGTLLSVETALRGSGFDVIATADPFNALPMLAKFRPQAMVLDIVMPGLSGWRLLDEIRSQPQTVSLPVILLSSLCEPSHRVRGLKAGADDYVTKPFDPEELVARVRSRLAHQVPREPGLQGRLEVQSIQELVQSLEQGAKTGELRVSSGRLTGRVLLSKGKAVTAECGEYRDALAVRVILELRSGRFVFTPQELSDDPADRESFGFTPLLMEEAWVSDELKSREQYLPSKSALLEVRSELGEIPAEMKEFPVVRVYEHLSACPGIGMKSLLAEHLGVPNVVRLVVAWLAEQGIVRLVEPSGSGELPEEVDEAIRDFFQDALFRGFSIEDLDIGFLVQEQAWDSLARLLTGLDDNLLTRYGRAARRQICRDRQGELPLRHESGRIALHFATLAPRGEPLAPISDANGVVLWLEENTSDVPLAALVADLETRALPAAGLLLVAPTEATGGYLPDVLGGASRWRLPGRPPVTLKELLAELIRAGSV